MPNANLFARPDTFFGICEGLGEDLGIHPNFLRLALAGALFWNPLAALAIYASAGAIVLATRLLFPNPRVAAPQAAEAVPARQRASAEGAVTADNEAGGELERLAA